MKHASKVFKISLSLALMVFVFTMTPGSSFFNIVKPVSAAALTGVSASPTSNVINERATYDFFLTTATSGTIKTIQIDFPSSFNLANIRLIERSGISSGSLSFSGPSLKYTLNNAESVSAGTAIRLEIARIIATVEGTFTVSIKTLNSQGGTIDGPTSSGSFTIKSITGNDISPSLMIKKTLFDNPAGNAKGWSPNGQSRTFTILDNDVVGSADNVFIDLTVLDNEVAFPALPSPQCAPIRFLEFAPLPTLDKQFTISCVTAPIFGMQLHYIITKLPANVVTSSLSVSESASLQGHGTTNTQDETSSEFPSSLLTSSQDIGSTNTQDETSSEFP